MIPTLPIPHPSASQLLAWLSSVARMATSTASALWLPKSEFFYSNAFSYTDLELEQPTRNATSFAKDSPRPVFYFPTDHLAPIYLPCNLKTDTSFLQVHATKAQIASSPTIQRRLPFARTSYKQGNAAQVPAVIYPMSPRPTVPLPVCISLEADAPTPTVATHTSG